MGTHSLTYIYGNKYGAKDSCIGKLYLQFDGNPDAIGVCFADFLENYLKANPEEKVDEESFMHAIADKFFPLFVQQSGHAEINPKMKEEEWEYHIYYDKVKIFRYGKKVVDLLDWRSGEFSDFTNSFKECCDYDEDPEEDQPLKSAKLMSGDVYSYGVEIVDQFRTKLAKEMGITMPYLIRILDDDGELADDTLLKEGKMYNILIDETYVYRSGRLW